jgi:hypothetical protein
MESLPEINLDTAKATARDAASSIKSAGSLVAKKAERTKLVTVTLPRAYGELGKTVFKESARREQFAELFAAIDNHMAERRRLQEEAKARPSATTLTDKAKQAAADAATLARTKAIDLQAFQAFTQLGEAVYQKYGVDSGPAEVVGPISKAVARRDQLDQETAAIDNEAKGRLVTPRRIAWGVGIVLGIAVLSQLADPQGPESNTNESGASAGTTATSSEQRPVKRSAWGPTQLAYKKRIDLCDNPDKYTDTEMKMEVKYRGGGIRQGGRLASMRCTVFYGDGSFEMAFSIPSDVSQPRIEPGQYLWVTFVFSGSVDSPSRVTAISRK